MDKDIYYGVCRNRGHMIHPIEEPVLDASGKPTILNMQNGSVLRRVVLYCLQCGGKEPFETVKTPRPRSKKAQSGALATDGGQGLKDLD